MAPQLRAGNRSPKAILYAIIDDHSRMVVSHAFSLSETINALTMVIKEAFLRYSIPKRLYVDISPSFSPDLSAKSCAMAGISLIHNSRIATPEEK